MSKQDKENVDDLEKRIVEAFDYLEIPKYEENFFSNGNGEPEEEINRGLLRHDAFKFKDTKPALHAHGLRVGLYSIRLLDFLKIRDEDYRRHFFTAALLHDIGKAGALECEDKIKNFTKEDMEKMKTHPITSKNLLSTYGEIVTGIVERHHFYQKNPYPEKTETETTPEIVLLSKILGIIDYHDAGASRENEKLKRRYFREFKLLPEFIVPKESELPSKKAVKDSSIKEYEDLEIIYFGKLISHIETTGKSLIKELYEIGIFGPENPLNPFPEPNSFIYVEKDKNK